MKRTKPDTENETDEIVNQPLSVFLNIFTYTSQKITNEGNVAFEDCVFLKDFGTVKKGEKVESVNVLVALYGWNKDSLDIDESDMLKE